MAAAIEMVFAVYRPGHDFYRSSPESVNGFRQAILFYLPVYPVPESGKQVTGSGFHDKMLRHGSVLFDFFSGLSYASGHSACFRYVLVSVQFWQLLVSDDPVRPGGKSVSGFCRSGSDRFRYDQDRQVVDR